MGRSNQQKANEAKQRGNTEAKRKHYFNAIIHYTESIKIDPNDATVLTNRSLCFLKMAQHFLALEDAKRAIKLQPDWSKGYYRKGQVYYSADKFDECIEAYQLGLEKCPEDETLKLALEKAQEKQKEKDDRENWYTSVGMKIGLVCGILLVVCDEWLSSIPALPNYKWKLLIVVIFVIAGAGCAEMYSQFWKMTSDALLMADENWFKAAKGGFGDALGMSVDGQSQAASPSQYPRPERRRPADIDTELKKGVVIEEMEEEDGAETDVKMEDVGEDLGEDIESKKDK